MVSLGKDGVFIGGQEEDGGGRCLHYPPASESLLPANVVSVTGAGDRWVWSLITNSMCRHIITIYNLHIVVLGVVLLGTRICTRSKYDLGVILSVCNVHIIHRCG